MRHQAKAAAPVAVSRVRVAGQGAWITLVALPMTLAALLVSLVRAPERNAPLQWMHGAWIRHVTHERPRFSWWAAAGLLAVVSTAVSAYLLLGIVLNLAYPLRADAGVGDWGGPTLAGRWALHAGGGLLFAVVAMWVLPALHGLAHRWLATSAKTGVS